MRSRIVLSVLLVAPLLVVAGPAAQAQQDVLIPHSTSWLGETIPPEDAAFVDPTQPLNPPYNHRWVQDRVTAMWADPLSTDGMVYTNAPHNELAAVQGVYQFADGRTRPVAYLYPQGGNGTSVTGDEKYLYADFFDTIHTPRTQKVVRFERGGDGYGETVAMAPFETGEPVASDYKAGRTLTGKPGGMTTGRGFVYVTRPVENLIYVYEREKMTKVATFQATNPGAIAFGHDTDTLFALTDAPSGERVVQTWSVDASGGLTRREAITDTGVTPVALAVNRNVLLVADNDITTQQVRYYGECAACPLRYKHIYTLGAAGGIVAAQGRYADNRFDSVVGVGIDRDGAVYVASNGGSEYGILDIRQFSPQHTLNAALVNNIRQENVAIDPEDPETVYSAYRRYDLDYSEKTPGTEWSPRHTRLIVDRATCTHDHRLPGRPGQSEAFAVRNLTDAKGVERKYLYVHTHGSSASDLGIYQVTDSGSRPSAFFTENRLPWPDGEPAQPGVRKRWVDTDADCVIDQDERKTTPDQHDWPSYVQAVDNRGSLWTYAAGALSRFDIESFDDNGNPLYGKPRLLTVPGLPVTAIQGMQYDDATGAMYLYGPRSAGPNPRYILARYDKFGTANQSLAWQQDMNYKPCPTGNGVDLCTPWSIALAGDRVYVADGAREPGGAWGKVRVFSTTGGAHLGYLDAGPEVANIAGWVDMTVSGITATKLPSGEHVIFREEVGFGRTLMYRYMPRAGR
ncbi:hypothetical protein [Amycolatopsis speibonae]|uniref:Uncharacterized protein n=1 Tax=Amycolatopsis speibonae TaxID=1450224 RepID=A0ABV7PEL7_9PSEU